MTESPSVDSVAYGFPNHRDLFFLILFYIWCNLGDGLACGGGDPELRPEHDSTRQSIGPPGPP